MEKNHRRSKGLRCDQLYFVIATGDCAMEAEQLNQIAATLGGLKERTADLRRYL